MKKIHKEHFLEPLNEVFDVVSYQMDNDAVVNFVKLSYTVYTNDTCSLCYGQGRLIQVWESKDSERDSHYQIISEYCQIPELDKVLEEYYKAK